VRLTRRLVPELRHRSLDHLASFFSVDNLARHRAFGDALATAYILRALIGRARERGVETLEQLVDLHDRSRHSKVRSVECEMRSGSTSVDGRATFPVNSALRPLHSALE
jgi:DNA polymerase III epsilon subunit-like protein